MAASLFLLQRLVVVDVLRPIVKIKNDFRVAIGQKAIDRMTRLVTVVIHEMIDEMVERKSRDVSFDDHQVVDNNSPTKYRPIVSELGPLSGRLTIAHHFSGRK